MILNFCLGLAGVLTTSKYKYNNIPRYVCSYIKRFATTGVERVLEPSILGS